MKKILLQLLFVLYFAFASLAQSISHYHAYDNDIFPNSFGFHHNNIAVAQYRLDSIDIGAACGGERERKLVFLYDDTGLLIQSFQYKERDLYGMPEQTRANYTYDQNGNINTFFMEKLYWDGWRPVYMGTFTFNENNNCVLYEDRVWDADETVFVNDSRREYSYDSQGRLIEERQGFWHLSEGEWSMYLKKVNHWDEEQIVEMITERWDNTLGVWRFALKNSFTHDENDGLSENVIYLWNVNSEEWTLQGKLTESQNGEWIVKRRLSWQGDSQTWSEDMSAFVLPYQDVSSQKLLAPFWYTNQFAIELLQANLPFGDPWYTDKFFYSPLNIDGIDKIESLNIAIFPNPCTNYISFNVPDITGKMQLEVYNINGQLLLSDQIISGEQVDVRKLERGMYFYRLRIGETDVKGKLVKE